MRTGALVPRVFAAAVGAASLLAGTASASRPPRPPPPPNPEQRFDALEAEVEALQALVSGLKVKQPLKLEVAKRLQGVLLQLRALEAATPVCPEVRSEPAPAAAAMGLINDDSELCLGVEGDDRHRAGAGVHVAPCIGERGRRPLDHQWKLAPAAPGYEFVRNEVSGLCLGVRGVDDAGLSAEVEVFDCEGVRGDQRLDNQWKVVETGRGAYQLRNRVSGLCLGVQGGGGQQPGSLALLDRCDAPRQGRDTLWRVVPFAAITPSVVLREAPLRPTPPPVVRVVPIADEEFAKVRKSLDSQSFGADKLRVLKLALGGKPVSVAQVKVVLAQFSFPAEKLDAVRVLNPTIVDRDSRYQLLEDFTFDSDKQALEAIIRN